MTTANEILVEISKFIFSHPLAAKLTSRDRDALLKREANSLYLDFREENASALLSVDCSSTLEQRDGDMWITFTLRPEVNYPSYGNGDPELVCRRINLIAEVASLAAEIKQKFAPPADKLFQTADEKAQKLAALMSEKAIRACVALHCKHMRVDGARKVNYENSSHIIPNTSLTVAFGAKTFTVHTFEGRLVFSRNA